MAEGLILEFSGVGKTDYGSVNGKLGIDMESGAGDWPAGLLMHTAGISSAGNLVVAEVWATQADQAAFLHDRLGPALADAGITSQPTVRWVPLLAFHAPRP
jgi:hypothetical protein